MASVDGSLPSPKFHSHATPPALALENVIVLGSAFCRAGRATAAAGSGVAGPPLYVTRTSFWFACRLKKPLP